MEPPKLTTEETYKEIVTANGLPVDLESFEGFSLCSIGSKDAKQVILYACGGGLLIHAHPHHIINLVDGYNAMKKNNQNVSIVVIDYGLCPGAPYPTQVRQMVSTVQHLLKSRAPETIHLSGDSAGGTLVLELLLHHLHPHPLVPHYTLPTGTRFGSAFLVSPGTPVPGIKTTASALQDPNPDYINVEMVDQFWSLITSTAEEGVEMPNPWIENISAPEEWWKGLPVGEVRVLVGGAEILRDSIVVWVEHLKKHHDGLVDLVVFPGEVHEQALSNISNGVKEEIASAKYWREWFENFKA